MQLAQQQPENINYDPYQIARASSLGLAVLSNQGRYIVSKHLIMLDWHLLQVAYGKIKRLLINMPPQHGKSTLASANFPAWYRCKFPYNHIILTAYESEFAETWGAKARDIVEEYGMNVFGTSVRKDKRAGSHWELKGFPGSMRTAGMGGAITGKPADLLIIEDPIKGEAEARSKALKDHQWDWYQSTAYTRLAPDGAIIIIQTRWAGDDLSGRVLKEEKEGRSLDKWTTLKMRAIAGKDDILGRQIGEALFPERYTLEHLMRIKSTLTPYWWAALYDSEPSPEEGNIFKRNWWRYYIYNSMKDAGLKSKSNPNGFDEITTSWDCSFKDKKSSSYVVGGVWGRRGADKYLLDLIREKMDYPKTKLAIQAAKWKYPLAKRHLIEDKANGTAVIADLKHDISGIIPVQAVQSKTARAHGCSSTIEAGNVFLPQGAPWLLDYVEELAVFPNGENDDQVDMTSQYLNDILQREGKSKPMIYGTKKEGK